MSQPCQTHQFSSVPTPGAGPISASSVPQSSCSSAQQPPPAEEDFYDLPSTMMLELLKAHIKTKSEHPTEREYHIDSLRKLLGLVGVVETVPVDYYPYGQTATRNMLEAVNIVKNEMKGVIECLTSLEYPSESGGKWSVTRRCIRNDGDYIDEIDRFNFDTKAKAIEDIIRYCAYDISYDFNYPNDKEQIAKELDIEKLKEHLEKKQRIWIWEWRRKGNGDLYILHETGASVDIRTKDVVSLNRLK